MNSAYFETNEKVASIHAYVYPLEQTVPDLFFLKGADCWGWATWKNRWELFQPNGVELSKELKPIKSGGEYLDPAAAKDAITAVQTAQSIFDRVSFDLIYARQNQTIKDWEKEGKKVQVSAIGNKAISFMGRVGANIKSQVSGMGDTPHMEDLLGAVKVMLDSFTSGEIDQLHICYTKFINTMKQEPNMEQLLPLSGDKSETPETTWDYIYEPDATLVIDALLSRYIETLIYHGVAENMASEQSSRMVAMKAASDNAGNVIDELTLVYNKARQAAITKEISEIVGGAAAVS